jgi:hypothetical protein
MTASAVDIVNERRLLIEEATHARQLARFGGVMDRMIFGRGGRHEPSRRINHGRRTSCRLLAQGWDRWQQLASR